MQKIVVYGGGHLGRQVYHHLRAYYSESAELIGYVDDTKPEGEIIVDNVPNLGGMVDLSKKPSMSPDHVKIVFAIGYTNMKKRGVALERVESNGYELFSVIHPRSMIESNANLEAGSIVLAGAVIDQQVSLGKACFVDIGVTIGENSQVAANNYFSAGVSVGGSVQIGENNFFGMDVTVTNDVKLGSNLFVNAKTLIYKDLGDNLRIVEMHRIKEIAHPE